MRVTRFQALSVATVLLVAVTSLVAEGPAFWLSLSLVLTTYGTVAGMGVSFPHWQMFGSSFCRARTTERVVALTFDDGPDPAATPLLLDLLKQRQVRATFFCIGSRVASNLPLARRIAAEGHAIENHSFWHSHWTNFHTVPRLEAELRRAQTTVKEATGRAPQFYRPPMGLTNQRVFRVARRLNLELAGYSVRGFDQRATDANRVLDRIQRGIRPGVIVLLHDGGADAQRLLTVAGTLIDRLQQQGYRFLRLDELLAANRAA